MIRRKYEIKIQTNPKLRPIRLISAVSFIFLVIGVGVVLDSAAMQWAGFVVVVLTALGVGTVLAEKDRGLSISEARKRLDEIEAEEKEGEA